MKLLSSQECLDYGPDYERWMCREQCERLQQSLGYKEAADYLRLIAEEFWPTVRDHDDGRATSD